MEVFLRNWQGASLAWYDEVGRLLLVWATFLGAAVATRDGTHYCVDFFVNIRSGRARRITRFLNDLVIASVATIFVVKGVALCRLELSQRLAVTGLSVAWQDAALVVGSTLVIVFAIGNVLSQRNGAGGVVE
jgi:TRAP-type C4-dicarboxylate transport system permease small subunit